MVARLRNAIRADPGLSLAASPNPIRTTFSELLAISEGSATEIMRSSSSAPRRCCQSVPFHKHATGLGLLFQAA